MDLENRCCDDMLEIKTIGDLKKYIADLPEDDRVYLFNVGIGTCVYDAYISYGSQINNEHNGKTWVSKGLYMDSVTCDRTEAVYDLKGDARLPIKNVEIRNVTVGEVTKFVKNVVNAENVVEENIIYKEKQDKQ
jgi:hypothetical protein